MSGASDVGPAPRVTFGAAGRLPLCRGRVDRAAAAIVAGLNLSTFREEVIRMLYI